jgi:hypothetical protein
MIITSQIKKTEMDNTCSTYGESFQSWADKCEGKNRSGDISVNGKIILKCGHILIKQSVTMWNGYDTVARASEQSAIKSGQFILKQCD